MNIWRWRSAVIIWVFAWGWFQAFDSCAPTRERWSVEHRQEEAAAAVAAEKQAELDRLEAERMAKMCAENPDLGDCQPEVSFLCSIFTCEDEEEGEASSP